jgi:hypothetical protein
MFFVKWASHRYDPSRPLLHGVRIFSGECLGAKVRGEQQ